MEARVLILKNKPRAYQVFDSKWSDLQAGEKQKYLRRLSDSGLLQETKRLAREERKITADVILHLAEIEIRKLFSPRYQSIIEYAIGDLGYSEDAAARRHAAMRLVIEFPEVERNLIDGSLSLSTLNRARTYFRNEAKYAEEHQTLNPVASREAKLQILAELEGLSVRAAERALIVKSSEPEKLRNFETTKPISATLNEIKIIADDEAVEKIRHLKGLLAHRHPHLTNGEAVSIALDLAIEVLDPSRGPKQKLASAAARKTQESRSRGSSAVPRATESAAPQDSSPTTKPSRYVPAQINREVWQEGEGKCALCGSTYAIERDHKKPFALGGETSKENLRLLCRNCNQRQAIKTFGLRGS